MTQKPFWTFNFFYHPDIPTGKEWFGINSEDPEWWIEIRPGGGRDPKYPQQRVIGYFLMAYAGLRPTKPCPHCQDGFIYEFDKED